MPELKLGLNDKLLFEQTGRPMSKGKSVEMEDIKFHQCVRLARFENDRYSISDSECICICSSTSS